MRTLFAVAVLWSLLGFSKVAYGQTFTLGSGQVDISVAPPFNHLPVKVPITGTIPANTAVSTDSSWVMPSLDANQSKLVLTFATSNLVSSLYTATIKVWNTTTTNTLFVRANVAPLNLFKLKDDPSRSRTYGLHMNALQLGSIVVLDPITTNFIGNITVGKKPSDFAISADGREMFVINCVDTTVTVIDLINLSVKETLTLPDFGNWGVDSTTANIAVGPGNILYYTDGSWAPVLRVLNRSTLQVLQSVMSKGSGTEGFGDIGLSSDKTLLYGWMQYGWSAGLANSYVTRFTVATNGMLTFTDSGASQYNNTFARDPLETPVLVTSDNQTFFIKGFAVGTNSASDLKYTFPGAVYSITPGGEVAATSTALYETATGIKLADLPVSSSVQAISSDYSRLVYYDANARAVKVLNLTQLIGPGIINRLVVPADGSITLSPPKLQWTPIPGNDLYHVYLGTAETTVANATTNSAAFLGASAQPSLPLAPLTPGTTYFWRVDAVSQFDITKGDVKRFTVSTVSSSTNQVTGETVKGHADFRTSISLSSATDGQAWQISADQPWVTFVQNSGTTPATVEVILNASNLAVGLQQANITVSSGGTSLFSIPVKLRVDPLNLTVVKSDPNSVFTYAISEDGTTAPVRAYLLEINTVTEKIARVARVGSSATDLTVHHGDNRIYVPNWLGGSLLAIDLNTFQQVRSYAFSPYGGMGYSENDIYRVSAAGPGRLVWEEQDQWIDINIFNTVAGTNMASAFVREGGGECSPDKRYYYHGENNSSGAALLKFDLTGDRFSQMASARVSTYSYYGTRVVNVSEDGKRIFWNGGIFNTNLQAEWTVSDQIYAASADGRFAFADTEVYDVDARGVVTNLPTSTVKAFNTVTSKLVYKNGNGISFYSLSGQRQVFPGEGVIIASPSQLGWQSTPVTTAYRVYLGQSSQIVATASTNSPLFLGEITSTNFTLNPLQPGIYYWRVDSVTPYGLIIGDVHSFIVSTITPSIQQITAVSFPNRPVTTTLTLSAAAGEAWQAVPNASWISLSQSNGVAPATIQITLDATVTGPVVRTGSIAIHGAGGVLFTIPVHFTIEALHLTFIKSDPTSEKLYAISENPTNNPSKAYLIEVNSATETIERVVSVGSSVTDLAVHRYDNRIYVPNWASGTLLAIDKNTLQQVKSYSFGPGSSYENDVYRVAAGAAGRLVVEEKDQWINMAIFNTVSGSKITNAFVREGGGAFDPTGRYYYHGDNNSSGAEIHKYDVTGDAFTELAHVRVESVSYYGSRNVVVSEDGSRVFWNGSVFDANLVEQWKLAAEIYSTSANGKYAFGLTTIYNTTTKSAVLGMPADTTVSAFNSTTEKLVAQSGSIIRFFRIGTTSSLPAPVLSFDSLTYNSVVLKWTDQSLEESFTIQRRVAGTTNWIDIATPARNSTQYVVTGLSQETTYEFRIKANATGASSDWSGVVTVTTSAVPPAAPTLNTPTVTSSSVSLSWSNPANENGFVLERSVGTGSYAILATLPADVLTYVDTSVSWSVTYSYRIKATNNAGTSGYSSVRTVTVPAPAPPSVPSGLAAKALSSNTILLSWMDVSGETGYRLQSRTEDTNTLGVLTVLGTNTTSYVVSNLTEGVQYFFRIQSFNTVTNSAYSAEVSATPANLVRLIEDDFDPALDSGVWAQVSGGVATNGGLGFRGSKALWFGGVGSRSATTVPVDVSRGGTVEFVIRAGNEQAEGSVFWNNSETGETVTLEYSVDGSNWSTLQTLNTVYPALSSWTALSVTIPNNAFSKQTQFRWRQASNSGTAFDTWAIDDFYIHGPKPSAPTAPPFIISSANSSTAIALFWAKSEGATSYIVERKLNNSTWTAVGTVAGIINYFTDTNARPNTLYYYRVKAANAGGESLYSSTTICKTWSQREEWVYRNFGSIDAMNEVDMVTPGTDGVLPLLRFAYNLSVSESQFYQAGQTNGFPAVWLDSASGRLYTEFVRRKASSNPGIRYEVRFTEDFADWTTSTTPVSIESIDDTWERVRYQDAAPAGTHSARFCRVVVIPE